VAWFRAQAKRMPVSGLSARYLQRLDKLREAATDVDEFYVMFTEWLEGEVEQFAVLMNSAIEEGLANGFDGSLQDWIDEFKLAAPPFDAAALLPDDVLKDAAKYAGQMVKGVTEDTAKQLSSTIAEALSTNRSVPELAKMLRDRYDEIGSYKSKLIAQTEMNKAISKGAFESNKAVGASEKEWIQTYAAEVPREEHIANMEQGRIPIGDAFQSGEDYPGEPNCHCVVLYYGATEEAVAELLGLT